MSFRVCVQQRFHSKIALRYFTCLDLARRTVRLVKSHVRPMNVGWSEKGMSLDVSQGMPKSVEMRSMSSML